MAKILYGGLSFDDVLLVPRRSNITSRFSGGIDLSVELVPGIKLKYPILSANMDSVTELAMCNAMHELGGLGIIHRFLPVTLHTDQVLGSNGPKVLCIGVGQKEYERFLFCVEKMKVDAILIDIAHGHSDSMLRQIERVLPHGIPIIAGNVATYDGAMDLLTAGICSIKCGVGPGSVCSTRVKTGNGVPQLTAIQECSAARDRYWEEVPNKTSRFKPTVIGDGGLKDSGDIVKCLAAGADVAMVGGMLAATEETPGELSRTSGGLSKTYRGMASRSAQESWKGHASGIEGEMVRLPYKGSVKIIFKDIIEGLLSGMSYQNARNIWELQKNAVFRVITSAGYRESIPHALLKNTL